MSIIARELDYSTPQEYGAPSYEFPFEANGDFSSFVVTRNFKQNRADFMRDKLSGAYRLGATADWEHAAAYLIATREPATTPTGLLAFQRSYAKVPATQTMYSTVAVSKPSPASYGTARGTVSDYAGLGLSGTGYTYGGALFVGNRVFPQKSIDSTSTTAPTGGTFTVTYKSSTTAAQAWNVSDGNLTTALNGLADSVSDGITWSCVNGIGSSRDITCTATAGTPAAWLSMNASSLTGGATTKAYNIKTYQSHSLTSQLISLGTKLTILSHGFASSGYLATYGASNCAVWDYDGLWSVVDANTISVVYLLYSNLFGGRYGSGCGPYLRDYSAGADTLGCKIISDFYLPGVSPGITTPTDISIPSPLSSDTVFLTAVAGTGTGYVDYAARDLTMWRGSPIYKLEKIQINLADL